MPIWLAKLCAVTVMLPLAIPAPEAVTSDEPVDTTPFSQAISTLPDCDNTKSVAGLAVGTSVVLGPSAMHCITSS